MPKREDKRDGDAQALVLRLWICSTCYKADERRCAHPTPTARVWETQRNSSPHTLQMNRYGKYADIQVTPVERDAQNQLGDGGDSLGFELG